MRVTALMQLGVIDISSIQNEDKGAKVKKTTAKGKKDANAAQNGETKNEVWAWAGSINMYICFKEKKITHFSSFTLWMCYKHGIPLMHAC